MEKEAYHKDCIVFFSCGVNGTPTTNGRKYKVVYIYAKNFKDSSKVRDITGYFITNGPVVLTSGDAICLN